MNKKTLLLTLLLFTFTSSVLAVTKSPVKKYGEVKLDKALVYFVRPSSYLASLRTYFIYSDQEFATALDNNTYSFTYLDPGEHLIWTNWTSLQKKMIFEEGRTYYFQIFDKVLYLSEEQGKTAVLSSANFATPTEKEIKKSAAHIKNRYQRASKKMGKDDYAEPISNFVAANSIQRPGSVLLAANKPIRIKLLENVTSVHTTTGQKIHFETAEDVFEKNKLLIAKGKPCEATLWHKDDGKLGGVSGSFELLVTSVTAVDGSLIPVFGQIATAQGTDRINEASFMGMYAGALGFLSVKSRQSFLFSYQEFTVNTKENVWITPVSGNKNGLHTENQMPGVITDNAYTAIINQAVRFQPHKKTKPKDITVELDSKFGWDELTLVGVNGIAIPEAVPAKHKVQSKKSQAFVFDGWSIVRFLPIGTGQNKFDLNFKAVSGGHDFPAVAAAALDLKAK